MPEIFHHLKVMDMNLLDYFAVSAPEPSKEDMSYERLKDTNKVMNNDRYVRRDDRQINCELRYKWAKEMMKVRGGGEI